MKSEKLLTFDEFRKKEITNMRISSANQLGKTSAEFTLFSWNDVPCTREEFDKYRYLEYIKDNTDLGKTLYE